MFNKTPNKLKDYMIIKASGLFDADYYRQLNHDVDISKMDPLWHYINFGAAEGRHPNGWFESMFYTPSDSTANPLSDFIQKHGDKDEELKHAVRKVKVKILKSLRQNTHPLVQEDAQQTAQRVQKFSTAFKQYKPTGEADYKMIFPETIHILNELGNLANSGDALQREIFTRMLNLKENLKIITAPDYEQYDVVLKAINVENARQFFLTQIGFVPDFYVTDPETFVETNPVPPNRILPYTQSAKKKKLLYFTGRYLEEWGLWALIKSMGDNHGELYTLYEIVKPFSYDFIHKHDYYSLDYLKANLEKIKSVYSLINEDASRDIFCAIILGYLTGNIGYFIMSPYQHYFHPKVHAVQGDVVLDCGAFAEYSNFAVNFPLAVGQEGFVHGFEPFFNVPESTLPANIKIIPCACGAEKKTSYFYYCGSGSAVVDASAKLPLVPIPTITIDDYVEENNLKPTLIKMDIEGGEMDALKGAQKTIQKYKPKLMISVYHLPHTQFLDIPHYISTLRDDYEFYYTHSMPSFIESVLFAIPKQ